MFIFPKDTLNQVLAKHTGVDLNAYGKPRDAFMLPINVPHWTSGFGGVYEMSHTNVPAGVMVAVGNLQDLQVADFAKLKKQLEAIDIYPTGASGDFSTKKLDDCIK